MIEIERRENKKKLDEMSFDEFINENRQPLARSVRIEKFLKQITNLAKYSDFKGAEFLDVEYLDEENRLE